MVAFNYQSLFIITLLEQFLGCQEHTHLMKYVQCDHVQAKCINWLRYDYTIPWERWYANTWKQEVDYWKFELSFSYTIAYQFEVVDLCQYRRRYQYMKHTFQFRYILNLKFTQINEKLTLITTGIAGISLVLQKEGIGILDFLFLFYETMNLVFKQSKINIIGQRMVNSNVSI